MNGISQIGLAALLILALYLPGHFIGGGLVRKDDGIAEAIALRIAAMFALGVPLLTFYAIVGVFYPAVIIGSGIVISLCVAIFTRRSDSQSPERSWRDLAVLIPVAVGIVLYWLPAEYVINSRDPGVYTLFADRLARTGELFHRDPMLEATSSFHSFPGGKKYPGFYILGGSLVVPQFFPGPSAVIGLGNLVGGLTGSLYTVPVIGGLSVGFVFLLGKEVFGRWAGLLGASILAVSYAQIWWSRHPSSEVMTQALIVSGLWLAVRFSRSRDPLTGVLAGLLLGGAMLVRVDAFLAALALPVLFAWELFVGEDWRRSLVWLWPGIPLAVFAVAAFTYLNTFGTRYLAVIVSEHGFGRIFIFAPILILALAIVIVLFFLLRRRLGGSAAEFSVRYGRGISLAAALILVGLALWGYFVIPVPWETLPAASRDFDAYRSQILLRLVWFTTPPVAVLTLVGLVLAARRINAGVFTVLCAGLVFALLYTIFPNVAPDLPWATRRFVPIAFPVISLLSGFAIVEIGRHLARYARPVLGIGLSGVLFALVVGWTIYLILPIASFRELEGAREEFDRIDAKIPASEVVFMEMPGEYDFGSSTFEYLYGRSVLPYDRLLFIRQRDEMRRAGLLEDAVYITTDGGPAPQVSGLTFEEVGEGRVVAPRIRPAETRIPDEQEKLDIGYRIFRVEDRDSRS